MSAGSAGAGTGGQRTFVKVAAAITATGGLLFGYDTGVISGALLFIKEDLGPLSDFVQGLIVSFLLVGAVVGALSGGPFTDRFGRRWTAMLAAIIFAIGALIVALTPNVVILIFGRFVLGLGVGLASLVVPLYIAEIAPPDTGVALDVRGGDYPGGGPGRRDVFLAGDPTLALRKRLRREGSRRAEADAGRRRGRSGTGDTGDREDPARGGGAGAGRLCGASQALHSASPHNRYRSGHLPTDNRHQHRHLLRSDYARGRRLLGRRRHRRHL